MIIINKLNALGSITDNYKKNKLAHKKTQNFNTYETNDKLN